MNGYSRPLLHQQVQCLPSRRFSVGSQVQDPMDLRNGGYIYSAGGEQKQTYNYCSSLTLWEIF